MDILESFKVTADALIEDLESSFNDVFKPSKKISVSSEYLRGQSDYFNHMDADKSSASVEYFEGYGDAYALGECESARSSQ